MKILIIDLYLDFIIELQKLFASDVEWIAIEHVQKIHELLCKHIFDYVITRKKNESNVRTVLRYFQTDAEHYAFLKKLVILPNVWWKGELLKQGV